MSGYENAGLDALYARLSDLSARAERGELAVSSFLSPREAHFAEIFLRGQGAEFFLYGGYEGAERKRVFCLPDYMEGTTDPDALSLFGESARISVLEVRGSGYHTLTHRDFLGALLGLGLERSVIGDICLPEEGVPLGYVWLDEAILPFVLSELCGVGRDTVKVKQIVLPSDFSAPKRVAPLRDTVPSARLDAVVAALCSLSREKASEAVAGGLVELNYEREERGDRTVTAPALISVRGYGKFRVLSVSEPTKKGRWRLEAEKYL